jgi:3-isopropylmalate/(R)-2-methylmalate dehydratase small subunit
MRRTRDSASYRLSIDLEKLTVADEQGLSIKFAMDEFPRHCLLNGLDDIALTLQHELAIAAYERKHPVGAEMGAILQAPSHQ